MPGSTLSTGPDSMVEQENHDRGFSGYFIQSWVHYLDGRYQELTVNAFKQRRFHSDLWNSVHWSYSDDYKIFRH